MGHEISPPTPSGSSPGCEHRGRRGGEYRSGTRTPPPMLAVVQDLEHLPVLQVLDEQLAGLASRHLGHAEGRSDLPLYEIRTGEGSQLHLPRAVSKGCTKVFSNPQGEPRLARAPGPGKRQETGPPEKLPYLPELAPTPDEAGHLQRQLAPKVAFGPALGPPTTARRGFSVGVLVIIVARSSTRRVASEALRRMVQMDDLRAQPRAIGFCACDLDRITVTV